MSYSQTDLRNKFQSWAEWRINGGWHYTEPLETAEGLKIRAPGTHTDPTLSQLIGMERAGECESAQMDIFIRGLPRLSKALIYSTFYDPMVDKQTFVLSLVLRDYGISDQVYWGQINKVFDALREHLGAIKQMRAA